MNDDLRPIKDAIEKQPVKQPTRQPSTQLRTPKGTVDYSQPQSSLIEEIINKTSKIFRLYGASPIDTPTFELKTLLMNKYGEEEKLIYDLKESESSLRYDLTVPFSRYISMNKIKKIKKYQIGKVFRRDNPSYKKGRLREFIQADFDIAGEEGILSIQEVEVISIINRLLKEFDTNTSNGDEISTSRINGNYIIKISDRRLLTSILEYCGITKNIPSVCSTIDKMEKITKEDFRKELKDKKVKEEEIDRLIVFLEKEGKEDLLDDLFNILGDNPGITVLRDVLKYGRIAGYYDNIKISLNLARGLDYYKGIIIEGEYLNTEVGSVVGGGRYLTMSGVSCVGFSLGVTRLYSLLEWTATQSTPTKVYVVAQGAPLLEERLRILKRLQDSGIPSETHYSKRSNLVEQKSMCKKKGIPYIVIVKEDERDINKDINKGKQDINKDINKGKQDINKDSNKGKQDSNKEIMLLSKLKITDSVKKGGKNEEEEEWKSEKVKVEDLISKINPPV